MRITSLQGSVAPQVTGQSPGLQAMWPGYADSSSNLISWYPPTSQLQWTGASFTARIDNGTAGTTGNVLTVSAVDKDRLSGGVLVAGTLVVGGVVMCTPLLPAGLTIVGLGTGTGGVGTYTLSGSATLASQSMWTLEPTAPDSYNIYKNGAPSSIAQVIPNPTTALGQASIAFPIGWFVDRNIPAGQSNSYTVTAMKNGQESAPSAPLVMTTLTDGASAQPTLPIDPATWLQPYALPVGGTTWTCTNTSISAVTGTGTGGSVGCSLGWALGMDQGNVPRANINGGDIIVLTTASPYTVPGSGYIIPAFNGTNGWTYIIVSQADASLPGYNGAAQTLPAYSNSTTPAQLLPITCTAIITAGSTSATIPSWTRKSGWYYVLFENNTSATALPEERLVVFTQGSPTIDWSATNALYPSAGLTVNAKATIRVDYTEAVTPYDRPAMATFLGGTGANLNLNAFQVNPGATKLRIIGLNSQTAGILNAHIQFQNWNYSFNAPNPLICESVYFDRCIWGQDTNSATFFRSQHGTISTFCNHFVMNQVYTWGICSTTGGDANNHFAGGNGHLFQNCYLQCGTEGIEYGGTLTGRYDPVANVVSDKPRNITIQYCTGHKPLSWLGGAAVDTKLTSITATGGTLAKPWPYATQSAKIQFVPGTVGVASVTGSFVNGSTAVSWPAISGSLPLELIYVTGTTPWGLFGQFVKNHWEWKAGEVIEAHHNLILHGWMGTITSYHAAGFTFTPRQQVGGGGALPNQYAPWMVDQDIYLHDNLIYYVGSPFYTFSNGDVGPSDYTARIKFSNNQCLLAPWTPQLERVYGIQFNGPVSDVILDQNTFIVYQNLDTGAEGPQRTISTVTGGNAAGTYSNTPPYGPNSSSGYQDRMTITNNILDSGASTNCAFFLSLTSKSFDLYVNDLGVSNLTINKNITINDTTVYGTTPGFNYAPGTINSIPYASLGMANYTGNNLPPLNPSDWNITSGIYATASTTGGAIGATIGTASSQLQITTAPSLPNAQTGALYSQPLAASGGTPPYTWNKVSISPNTLLALTVSPAGVVQGTPQSNETSTIIVQVNDSAIPPASAQATLTLTSISIGSLAVSTTTLPNYTQGAMYYGQLIAGGGVAPYVWSGSPPAGVRIERSGQISVDSVAAGPFTFTATVTDAANTSATSGTLTITVDTVLRFANVDPIDGFIRLPDGYASTLYGQAKPRFMAFGGTPPYTFSGAIGNMIVGSTGTLSGTVSAKPGARTAIITVTDSATPTPNTATATALLNVLSQDKVTRPAYNTGAGYFVHSDGTFRDPNGYKFIMRGMNRDHYDNACMPSMAVIGPNAIRYTAYTYGVSVAASTYESGMNTDHIGNKEFVFLSGFFVVGTTTQLSGRGPPAGASDIQGVCNYLNQNIAVFNPIMNKMGLNIANEWGTGNQSLTGNALFLQTYDGALVNITSISGTTINFTSAAGTNPLTSQTFGWIQGVSGLTNQTVGLSGAAGTGPNYSITSSVSLGTFGAGGQLGGGAVCALRAAGWTCPIIIDECGRNGQNQGNILGGNAAIVNGHDPQKNCIFNTHQYNVGTPGRAQIASVTTGATTVLHFNNSSATNPFSNVGALPEIGMTLIGMAGGTWPSVNGQTFAISQGGGSFSGGAGTWAVTIPLDSTGLGAYTAGSGFGFDSYNPAITAKNFAALQSQGVCAMIEEFGPVTAAGPSPTILAPTDIIQAAEAYGIHWFYWAYDDGNPFGLMTTLPAPNFAVSNLSTYAGQALVMHARMNWLALAISPPALLP